MRCNTRSVNSTLRSVRAFNYPYGSNELNVPLTDRYNAGVLDNPLSACINISKVNTPKGLVFAVVSLDDCLETFCGF